MRHYIQLVTAVVLLASCSAKRFVPKGEHLLESARVSCDNPALRNANLSGFIHQHPNSKWFGVFKVPMGPYLLQGKDTAHWSNRLLRRIGEAPEIYDSLKAQRTCEELRNAVTGMGYTKAQVEQRNRVRKHKIHVTYDVRTGPRTYVHSIDYDISDNAIRRIYMDNIKSSRLHSGMAFDIGTLNEERDRIVSLLANNGYHAFNRSYIDYLVDTTRYEGFACVTLRILPYRSAQGTAPTTHTCYTIDTVMYDDNALRTFRPKVLASATTIKPGETYRERNVTNTYNRFARLNNVLNANVSFAQTDSARLAAGIALNTTKKHAIQFSPEATNTAGDLGVAVGLTYQNRNIFRGGELLSLKFRTAYEAIKGLKGYSGDGYFEYSAEATLSFPSFKLPFLSRRMRNHPQASTEVALMFDDQRRPEFQRRVLTGTLRYRWFRHNRRTQHRLDLLDLNYIYMPWISETFRHDYLDDATSRNAILRYNYENLFIMKLGYTYSYTSRNTSGNARLNTNSNYSLRVSVETAGNLMRAISGLSNNRIHSDGYMHFLGIAYAQYVKGDIDFSKTYLIDERNSFAFHTYLGIAYPYGNSTILPYEKRFFSGGANSVRGWSVRELGPGSFRGTDGRIDFINQTGDIKLDLSVEFRTRLFWKVQGAVFVDAGNIWTIRNYPDQPGGQFRFDTFWRQLAVAYGIGFRLNFDYFVVRLDGGMKAINPAYQDSKRHYPIVNPKFSRDFALHFAVGMPF